MGGGLGAQPPEEARRRLRRRGARVSAKPIHPANSLANLRFANDPLYVQKASGGHAGADGSKQQPADHDPDHGRVELRARDLQVRENRHT